MYRKTFEISRWNPTNYYFFSIRYFFLSCCAYAPMQEVTPKVVAIAVNTVMTMWRILLQRFLFIVMSYKLWVISLFWVLSPKLWVMSEPSGWQLKTHNSKLITQKLTSLSGSADCSLSPVSTSLLAFRWISSFLVVWPYRQMDSYLA